MISYFFLVFAKYFPIKTKICKELGGQQNLLKNEEKGEKTKPNPLQHMVTEHTNGDEDEKGGKTHPSSWMRRLCGVILQFVRHFAFCWTFAFILWLWVLFAFISFGFRSISISCVCFAFSQACSLSFLFVLLSQLKRHISRCGRGRSQKWGV